jgi:hypothetical protein
MCQILSGRLDVLILVQTPALHFSNIWYGKYLPMSSRGSFDNTGNAYDVTQILTPELTLDIDKYKAYSPIFLSTVFAVSYGTSFASITATVVHAFLYFRKQIWSQARRSLREQPDVHARLMSRYAEVPEWWYGLIFAAMFVFGKTIPISLRQSDTEFHAGIVAIEVYHTEMPVWAFVLALAIGRPYLLAAVTFANLDGSILLYHSYVRSHMPREYHGCSILYAAA